MRAGLLTVGAASSAVILPVDPYDSERGETLSKKYVSRINSECKMSDKLQFVEAGDTTGRQTFRQTELVGLQIQTEDGLCYPTASSLWKKKGYTYKTLAPIAA